MEGKRGKDWDEKIVLFLCHTSDASQWMEMWLAGLSVNWDTSTLGFMVTRGRRSLVIPWFLLESHYQVDLDDFISKYLNYHQMNYSYISYQTFMFLSGWSLLLSLCCCHHSHILISAILWFMCKTNYSCTRHQNREHVVVVLVLAFSSKPHTAICYAIKKIKAAKIQYHPWVKLKYYKEMDISHV